MSEKPESRSEELHELLSHLGRCVQESVTGSPEVAAALERIRERGYEPSFVVETSVTSSSASGNEGDPGVEMRVAARPGPDQFEATMTPLDKKFLRSLKISVE